MKTLLTLAAFLFILSAVIMGIAETIKGSIKKTKKLKKTMRPTVVIQQHEDFMAIHIAIEKCKNHQQLGFCLGKIRDFEDKYGRLASGAADVILLTELSEHMAAQFDSQSYCSPQVFPEFSKIFN